MATTTYGTPYVSGTDLVSNWPAASLTVANSIDAAGYYIGRGNNTQTASYTAVLTDAGKTITMSNVSANTVTIPANASVAFPTGTQINILNLGAGACTPTAGVGVTISGTITALAINEFASLVKTATNTWSYLVAATPAAPGLALVTPTSVAGTGVTLSGGQVTFTAASTASINGCFTATYDNYVIFLSATLSASAAFNFRLRVAGVDSSAAIYSRNYFLSRTAVTGGEGVNATSQTLNLGESTSLQVFKLEVFGPAIAAYTHTFTQNKNNYTELNIQGMSHAAATAYDGFTLFPASGTFTGTLRVYGLRNS